MQKITDDKNLDMKNIILLLLLLAGGGSMAVAQGKLTEEKRKEFEAQKVAFFTRELDLSPSEAAVFWPLYNEMRKKRREIEGQMRKGANEVNKASALSLIHISEPTRLL